MHRYVRYVHDRVHVNSRLAALYMRIEVHIFLHTCRDMILLQMLMDGLVISSASRLSGIGRPVTYCTCLRTNSNLRALESCLTYIHTLLTKYLLTYLMYLATLGRGKSGCRGQLTHHMIQIYHIEQNNKQMIAAVGWVSLLLRLRALFFFFGFLSIYDVTMVVLRTVALKYSILCKYTSCFFFPICLATLHTNYYYLRRGIQ